MTKIETISRLRFECLAGYTRQPLAHIYSEERAWFCSPDEKILGFVFLDKTDGDYGGSVLGRDLKSCFRWINMTNFYGSHDQAEEALIQLMNTCWDMDEAKFAQGDERGPIIDFFDPVVPEERLNLSFKALAFQEGFSPAKELIASMMHYFGNPDGNFVEQFQTTGFDARIWELYLFAAFHELGFAFDNSHDAPDFHCNGIGSELFVEATTANPTMVNGKPVHVTVPESHAGKVDYLQNYLPIKYGSALFNKLRRKYWNFDHVIGKPFGIAVQDFITPLSMTNSSTALLEYVFGRRQDPATRAQRTIPIESHSYGEKEIPSGFFYLPNAENVGAVFFNPAATISKFNRIGVLAGFGSDRVQLTRIGNWYDHTPEAAEATFRRQKIQIGEYEESWVEGLNVMLNHRAQIPFDPDLFQGAAIHYQENDHGEVKSFLPQNHPFGSITQILVINE